MAILDVTENFTGVHSNDRVEPDGRRLGATARLFDVLFDNADNTWERPILALSDSRVPQLGESLPGYPWIFVLNRIADVDSDSDVLFHVTVQYQEIMDPLQEPPIIEWLSAATNEPIDTDWGGNPLLNSSDEQFDPPITEDFDDLVLRANYNVSVFNPLRAMNYKGAINSDFFLGFAPGLAKVRVYSGREIRAITSNYYVAVTLEIHFRSTGWSRTIVDMGFRTKGSVVDGLQEYDKILDKPGGTEITEPVKLDGFGQRLVEGAPVVKLEFWSKPQLPFTIEFL